MDPAGRLEYLALTMVMLPRTKRPYMSLCAFCRLCTWVGQPGDCGEGVPLCQLIRGEQLTVLQGFGADCDDFEPMWVREDCVDAIGMLLRGQQPNPATMRVVRTPS